MSWYKLSQSDSLECEMSPQELIIYSDFIVSDAGHSGGWFKPESSINLNNEESALRKLIDSGGAPLAFSRCIRKSGASWGIEKSILPWEAMAIIFNYERKSEDGPGKINFPDSTRDETKRNLAHWYMESFLPALFKYVGSGPVDNRINWAASILGSRYVDSEMISRFWEYDRQGRENALANSKKGLGAFYQTNTAKAELRNRNVIYRLFLQNQNTPAAMQVEIVNMGAFNPESFSWILKNPNGSGEAMRDLLERSKNEVFTLHFDYGLIRRLFGDIRDSKDAKINDSVAEALSGSLNWLWDYIPKGNSAEERRQKLVIVECLYGLASVTQSKKAMDGLLDLAMKIGGLEETQHSLEPLRKTHFFSAYTPTSATMGIMRLLSPFIINHQNTDNEKLQKILAYVSSIDNFYIDDEMSETSTKMFGYDTVGLIFSAYTSFALGYTRPHMTAKNEHDEIMKIHRFIFQALDRMDMKNFQANALETGMSKLKMYKERIGQVRIKTNRINLRNYI